jgi:hypothetical protein
MQQRTPAMAQQVPTPAQAQQARMAMMQKAQMATSGQATLKLMNFVDQIARFDVRLNSVDYWQDFVERFFTETGSFIQSVSHSSRTQTKQFEIVYAALPRYFCTLFNNTVTSLQITIDGAQEKVAQTDLKVTCTQAKFIYTYHNQCQVVYPGVLTAFWSGSDKMEWLEFKGEGHQQMIPRSSLEALFHQPSPNQMNPHQSPRMNKNAKQKLQLQQRAAEPSEAFLPISKLPKASTTEFGLPPVLQGYLEVSTTPTH